MKQKKEILQAKVSTVETTGAKNGASFTQLTMNLDETHDNFTHSENQTVHSIGSDLIRNECRSELHQNGSNINGPTISRLGENGQNTPTKKAQPVTSVESYAEGFWGWTNERLAMHGNDLKKQYILMEDFLKSKESMEEWKNFIGNANVDIFDVLKNAIKVAASDHPNEFRTMRDKIAEMLYSRELINYCRGGDMFKKQSMKVSYEAEEEARTLDEVLRIKAILDKI